MFTAVVLVCLSGQTINSPETCFTYTNEAISETLDECNYAVYQGINLGIFSVSDPERGEYWEPVDWYCINWEAERV